MKLLKIALIVFILSAAFQAEDVEAACNDSPSTPNNGWCVPDGWGGQKCTTWPDTCNCTCDQPPLITV
jgi:hypothetical protein